MPPEAGHTSRAVADAPLPQAPEAESWEVRLASQAAARLHQTFPQKPRSKVINELLEGLSAERRARERLNPGHWPEYGPRFLGGLAERWKLQEAERVGSIAAFLTAKRKEAVRLALAVTGNLPDAELAVAESNLEYLKGAVSDAYYLLALRRNAVDIVRKRQSDQDVFVPLERAFEAGDDCAADADGDSGRRRRTASEPAAPGSGGEDPLQILIDRQDRHLRRSNLSRAKKRASTRRKHWWIRQKKWGRNLASGGKTVNETPRSFDY